MAEKKKILYIVEAMGGGVFTYIVDLANELVNKYDMYIAYAVRKQTPKNYKDYFDKRIHLIEVKNFGRAINPTKDIAAFFEVKKIAAEVKPDVIHLHSSKAGAIGRVAFDGKIPMFYTPHGYSFLMENCNPTKRRVFKLIESVCAKRNCTTISCSVGEHQETLKLTKNAAYVNNGINMKELQEIVNQTEKVAHPFTVFTLGRICYQKNPTLFNTIAELLPDVRFWFISTLMQIAVLYCCIDYVIKKVTVSKKANFLLQGAVSIVFLAVGYRCALTDSIWGGVNRVLSYYCLFYLGAVVRELQKTVRTEKYHYWKMVVAFLILVLCNQIGSIALDENRYENPAFLLVVSICGWVLLYEIAQELKKKKLLADAIVCCGQNSMAIVVLHFLCFKIISLVGVVVYNQPRERIAAFPVLYEHGAWWVTYMFAGIIVPVLLSVMWKKLKGK